jgi:hypothetical protein
MDPVQEFGYVSKNNKNNNNHNKKIHLTGEVKLSNFMFPVDQKGHGKIILKPTLKV